MNIEEIANEILNGLFVNGNGDEARRLVLELPDGRNGGGWSRVGAYGQIVTILQRHLTSRALDGACESCKLELTPSCPIRTGKGCDLYQPRQ